MKNTATRQLLATYPLTIGSPFGDIRLSYEMDTAPCSDCGKFHAAINIIAVPDGLSKESARVFLGLLPEVMEEAALLVNISAFFEGSRA